MGKTFIRLPQLRGGQMNAQLIIAVEIYLMIKELIDSGLNEEELLGFISLYCDDWELKNSGTQH